ncbi:short-chain dehydrogenase [Desulfocucumis palustris]|uniref:Short-chain dehydrogenase n=1 Tax=Desulfocucumis palustris TaxID=1898651 RepID=A0A2L2XE61_9FIRM|nr:SDR family oxidoreductase [Desulfocucumis palustris]GBF34412.1 short-chain dehydrogenase [Desulfocucumis palustris]
MKTVFITGASSGIGKETAKLFQERGWNVIATMRNPQAEKELVQLKNIKILQCDVTEQNSIKTAVNEGIKAFGNIDVLVNNAGYYILGPFEAATHEQIKRQIDTNLFGLIEVTKEIVPHFRKQKSGTIINVSSIAGIISIPLQTLYHATKWGVEGFSESLQYELRPFNIRVKIIEPGVIKTDFYGRSMTVMQDDEIKEYESYSQKVVKNILKNGEKGSSPDGVAKTIYKAATDNSTKLRYPTGYSKEMISIRAMLPLKVYTSLVRSAMEK